MGMKLFGKVRDLTVTGALRFKNGAKMLFKNADGTESTIDLTELGALDGLLATTAEMNRAADVSTRLVAAGSSLTLTEADHEGKIIALDTAAGSTVTLPAATGSGGVYTFVVTTVPTSNQHTIQVADATDVMDGNIFTNSTGDTPDLTQAWPAAADSDTITLNGTTQGGSQIGDKIELIDVGTNQWVVNGLTTSSGTEATPFSAAVS